MHKVSITIRSPKRSGTIVFSYEQYAYDGSWEISGDSAIIYLFDQEVKRTKTLSGISKGITPVAAANATKPEPAGNEIPIGKRVWLSPPVPTVSGNNMRLSQEWMMPSPGFKLMPPRLLMNSGNSWCIFTSTGLG